MDKQEILLVIKALLILCWLFLAYIDIKSFRLPNAITLPLIPLGFVFNIASDFGFADAGSSFLGAIAGYTLFWGLNFVYRLFKDRDGIGMGDAKLLAGMGAWLGLSSLPSILLIASLSGAIGGFIWLKYKNYQVNQVFPFGPFLVIAGIIQLLWPQLLTNLLLPQMI
jgi:leader peptidase (prepilin peptidase) / N-methyltransferase